MAKLFFIISLYLYCVSEKNGLSTSVLYHYITTILGNEFRHRLKGFTIHGEPDNVEIYVDGSPTNQYMEQSINVSLPESCRNTKFSNITIAIPAYGGYSILTLCEVVINLGKCITCGQSGRMTWFDLDLNDLFNTVKVMSSRSVYLATAWTSLIL